MQRLQPLLPKGFAKAEDVDKAQTAEQVATASLAAAEQRLNQAKTALSNLAMLHANGPARSPRLILPRSIFPIVKSSRHFPAGSSI